MLEIMPGIILHVHITLGEIDYTFFYVYAWNVGQEHVLFFGKHSDALLQCPQDNVVMGVIFNCTINPTLDRNHDEPHPLSDETFKNLINRHDFIDLWREDFPGVRQYTWLKRNSNNLSGARLDRFYVRKRHRDRFFNSCISPSFFLITIIFQCLFLLHLLKSINHTCISIIDCYKITTSFNHSIFSGNLGEKREIVFSH